MAPTPSEVYRHTIVSLPWLRGPKVERLLFGELLRGAEDTARPFFDLLMLDEAHHIAPAAPKQCYAVDSQQTRTIRALARHFTHRLFLSATPHNGYPESFTALLEILDPARFARGVLPSPAAQEEVVIRRLKSSNIDSGGRPEFPAASSAICRSTIRMMSSRCTAGSASSPRPAAPGAPRAGAAAPPPTS